MNTYVDKSQKPESKSAVTPKKQKNGLVTFQLMDNRSEAVTQRKLQKMANESNQVSQLRSVQEKAHQSSSEEKNPIQKKPNNTGLPDNLKTGIENLSGYSMDDVKVHYNSAKPAQLNAHAYAQGTNIHLASGQEKHLPHEAWHVVQQKQGRVKPTMQLKGKANINDDKGLEKEADVMGGKALRTQLLLPEIKEGYSIKSSSTVQMVHKLVPITIGDMNLVRLIDKAETKIIPWLEKSLYEGKSYSEKAIIFLKNFKNGLKYYKDQLDEPTEPMTVLELTITRLINYTIESLNKEIDKSEYQPEVEEEEEYENPLSVPKMLYRWVSTDEAKDAKKNGIKFNLEGGGIPTSTKDGKGIAIQSGAVNVSKQLIIDTSKISGFKFQYVPTRSKLKEVKILCDVPASAIS